MQNNLRSFRPLIVLAIIIIMCIVWIKLMVNKPRVETTSADQTWTWSNITVSASQATGFELEVANKMQQQGNMIVLKFQLTKREQELITELQLVRQNIDVVWSKIKTIQSETNDIYKNYLYWSGGITTWTAF